MFVAVGRLPHGRARIAGRAVERRFLRVHAPVIFSVSALFHAPRRPPECTLQGYLSIGAECKVFTVHRTSQKSSHDSCHTHARTREAQALGGVSCSSGIVPGHSMPCTAMVPAPSGLTCEHVVPRPAGEKNKLQVTCGSHQLRLASLCSISLPHFSCDATRLLENPTASRVESP